ncbi:integral membrane protein [Tremella mesenterica]|uniref:Integral membrane protein n=1 Tax=Tremella mesenterica TaxID=5217 RepID=A0A4Q1BP62_TREME|nr:uncharacterized protein TREMEDRAFT_45647 [Tremella mesenterica DSM 1558]EIW66496.1 hypothetical protein TREMEDRAFT_45647 [Tremella mesenterica DSM 1558]RXK39675.1 integral membrane protein [Tremella mesenterica]
MPLTRRSARVSSSGAKQDPLVAEESSSDLTFSTSSLLLTYDQSLRLVPWQTDNDYVLTGYRRQQRTIQDCLRSSVAYLHNETVNIHSHSLGAAFFAILLPLHLHPTHFPHFSFSDRATPVPPTLHDKVALTLYLSCAMTCLGLSSWFHTVQCHSKATCDAAHRGDYRIGIVTLIVGSILPGMYYAFHDSLFFQTYVIAAISAAGIASAYIVLSPHHRAHRWHRTLTFIALGLSAVIPVGHVVATKGISYSRQVLSLDLLVAGGVSYIFGAVLYAARFPEQLAPGRFDYFGHSHQIFHLFVLAGAGCQYAALRGMVWGRAMAVGHQFS